MGAHSKAHPRTSVHRTQHRAAATTERGQWGALPPSSSISRFSRPDPSRAPGVASPDHNRLRACSAAAASSGQLNAVIAGSGAAAVDGAIVALVFHGALRRSEVAALRWTDVDLSVGDDIVVVTVPGSKTNPSADGGDVRQLVGGCAAALRRLHAATKPAPANSVVGLGVHQINRRFSAACAAAGLEGRRTPHSGRVGLAVELAARGATTRDVQLAGGWKNPGMVARYAARVGAGAGTVGRFMRVPAGGKPDS